MRIILVLSIFFCSLFCQADNFDFRDQDKQLHMLASYGLGMTSIMAFQKYKFSRNKSIVYGSLVTLAIGALKEYAVDKTASSGDMVANGIGTTTSALVVWTFEL